MIIVNALLAVMWFVLGAVAFHSSLASTCAGIIVALNVVMLVSRYRDHRRRQRAERRRARLVSLYTSAARAGIAAGEARIYANALIVRGRR